MDVQRGQRERAPGNLALGRLGDLAAVDQADVARGAAHVEAQHVALAGQPGEQQRAADAAGRPGEHGERGVRGGARDVGEAARGLHDLRFGQRLGVGFAGEPAQVVAQQRRQSRVERGRGGALELAKRADEIAGQRKLRVRQQLGDQLAEQSLVLGMRVGMQQRDGDGLGLGCGNLAHERARSVGVELAQRPVGCHALGRCEAQLGGHERGGRRVAQAIQVRARLARELEHVGEAVGGDQRGACGMPLQQRVGGDGHAVREAAHIRRLRACALEHQRDGVEHGRGLLSGRGGDLRGVDGAIAPNEHRVGEGAADIDPEEHASEPT